MINLRLDGDGALEDVRDRTIDCGRGFRLILLAAGTRSGRHAVAVAIEMPDGRVAVAQATADELLAAARAIETRITLDRDQEPRT